MTLSNFTIVTITYNNSQLVSTYNSLEPLLINGATHIIQNGGDTLDNKVYKLSRIYNEPDNGIYDAINKGISKVETEYFMLIHADDTCLGSPEEFHEILVQMNSAQASIALNSQRIGKRLHSSRFWRPWMLHCGVQPPHMPTIFEASDYQKTKYSLEIPIIADFEFFYSSINYHRSISTNYTLVQMSTGGSTSSGFQSFIKLNGLFVKYYGVKGFLWSFTRVPFKVLQSLL